MAGIIEDAVFKRWDLWWAFVGFEGDEGGKERPVIILESGEVLVVSIQVTSHAERGMWGEYDITGWKSAGLDKPSTARLTKIAYIERCDFRKRIGRLCESDIVNIQLLLAQMY